MRVKFVRDTTLDGILHQAGETKEYPDPIARKLIDTESVVEAEREIPEPVAKKEKVK
jgi:hypothetical protein